MWPRDAYVGQRVVCVDDKLNPSFTASNKNMDGLTRGKIYTLRKVGIDTYWGTYCFWLDEIVRPVRSGWEYFGEAGYLANRFKPVDESRLDVFREMLKNVPNRKDVVRPETV